MTFFFEHEADDVDGILLGYENLRHVKCSVTPGHQKIPEPQIFRVFKGILIFVCIISGPTSPHRYISTLSMTYAPSLQDTFTSSNVDQENYTKG